LIALQGIDILDLQASLRISLDENRIPVVFDPLRKKNIRSTPEEIVRQLWIVYFLEILKLNRKLIAVERAFRVEGMMRRFDLVIFDKSTHPVLLAEFKGPEIPINQMTFDQIARYNMQLNVPYALVSNGRQHYCFQIDDEERKFVWQEKLPVLG